MIRTLRSVGVVAKDLVRNRLLTGEYCEQENLLGEERRLA